MVSLLLKYKKGCILLSVSLYILVFFLLYPLIGTITPMFSVIPVLFVGWGYGLRGGFAAGLLNILLNTLLLNLAGYEPAGWDALLSREGGVLGSLSVILIGITIGKMSDLARQLQQEILHRQGTEDELAKSKESLELRVMRRTEELSKQLEEAKQAKETLRKTQEMLSEGQSLAKFGTVQRNLQTGEGWWSDEVYNILGISPKEGAPTTEAFLERVHPHDVEWIKEMIAKTRETGNADGEYRIIRSSGEELTIYGRARMHHDALGNPPVWMISTLMDITERNQAEMKLQALSRHLIQTQELERRRIALELHDQLGQDLALLSIGIEQLMQKAPQSQARLGEQLQELSMKSKELASTVQTLSHQLHPAQLVHLGLVTASRSLCSEVSQSSAIQIHFSYSDISRSISSEVSTCLYRVLQESLTNIVKHSGAKAARVELAGSPREIQLQILDSGVGFDPESTGSRGGLGLISMRERLNLLGGQLLIESRPAGNTRIKACLPLNPNASPD